MATQEIKDTSNVSTEKDITQINTEIANEIVKDRYNLDTAQEFMNTTNDAIKSGTKYQRTEALQAAGDFTAKLLLLCLMQEIEDPHSIAYIENLANKFDDGYIAEGNGKEYIIDLLTGSETFVITDFNPTSVTSPSVYSEYIRMYDRAADGTTTLNTKAYQFKKPLTIQEPEWLPYFTSGSLRTFIEKIVNKMIRSFVVYKYNKIATLIASIPYTKLITGTAANLFEALSLEVLPEIEHMTMLNQSYSIDNVNKAHVDTLPKEDMLMFVPLKVKTGLMHGIQSQLYNSHLMDIDCGIPKENVIVLNDKIVFPTNDANAKVSVTDGTSYIPDDTIIVLDKKAIRHLQQLYKSGSQSYNNNLTIQMTIHIWGVVDYLPWRKAFKYVNPNILKMPGQATETPSSEPVAFKASKKAK